MSTTCSRSSRVACRAWRLCCYWLERARGQIAAGRAKRAGLVATAKVDLPPTGSCSATSTDRRPVHGLAQRSLAVPDAAHRVALLGFDDGAETVRTLSRTLPDLTVETRAVARINAVLAEGLDLVRLGRCAPTRGWLSSPT